MPQEETKLRVQNRLRKGFCSIQVRHGTDSLRRAVRSLSGSVMLVPSPSLRGLQFPSAVVQCDKESFARAWVAAQRVELLEDKTGYT
jgi:hypothetical protein